MDTDDKAQIVKTILMVFGAISSLLGPLLVAYFKNKKYEVLSEVLSAVIRGVETAGHPETKMAIQDEAETNSVQQVLDPIVQKVTDGYGYASEG